MSAPEKDREWRSAETAAQDRDWITVRNPQSNEFGIVEPSTLM